jgi:hypothetical protein
MHMTAVTHVSAVVPTGPDAVFGTLINIARLPDWNAAMVSVVDQPHRLEVGADCFWRHPPTAEAREVSLGEVCPGLEFDTVEDWVRIYEAAGLTDLDTVTGPFEMMTARGFLAHQGVGRSLAIIGRVASWPANVREMAWLMPRMAKAVPYLGYIVVAATKPA